MSTLEEVMEELKKIGVNLGEIQISSNAEHYLIGKAIEVIDAKNEEVDEMQ
ncbi:hypothetical protein ACFLUG_02695 [Chloroflexota bacterium]